MGPRTRRLLGVTIAAVGAVTVSGAAEAPAGSERGGTYRVGWEGQPQSFFGTDGFDPTVEYEDGVRAIHTNLVVRTLVGYNHVAGPAGMRIVPDLAVRLPTPTNGGRRYTFTLKRGIRFGPPVNREIRSRDIKYAIERLARPKNGSYFAYYFSPIQGFDAYRAGKASSIAGVSTPSPKTIAFTLTHPVGDFLHRLALPASGPIPVEVARCFEGRPGAYTRDVVSSGPYMIDGAGAVKLGSCAAMAPMRGASLAGLTLTRNPNYEPATDTRAARESNPDRFVFVPSGITPQIVGKLTRGELEDAYFTTGASSRKVLDRYAASARKRGALRLNPAAWPHYITMNLTQPPFDDVQVRRALSWVIDKAELRTAFGGPGAGTIAGHIVPDEVLGGRLDGFAPFRTAGDHGSLARAKAEMAKSKYATRGGVCVASACKEVFFAPTLNDINFNAGERMGPMIREQAAKIGITLRQSTRDAIQVFTPSRNLPISPSAHWLKDYPDPADYIDPFFAGSAITPQFNVNTSLVGITPARAARVGAKGRVAGVPSVDRDIARCTVLSGSARLDCYAALDRKLSTQIVPWIPFLWRNRINILGPQIAKWTFDSAAGMTAYAHVAVKR